MYLLIINPNQLSLKATREDGSLSPCFLNEKWREDIWGPMNGPPVAGAAFQWMRRSFVAPREGGYWFPLDVTGLLPVGATDALFFLLPCLSC